MRRNEEVIRQWKMLRQIASTRRNTIPKLAQEFTVNARTIRRDLAALQAAGFPLYDDTVNGTKSGGWIRRASAVWRGAA